MISVSKLCCPVCWELFEVLNLHDFICAKVRGCHPTVTQIALPETFPLEVSDKMITRLRALLAGQLRHLLLNRPPRTQHFRNESETGFSAASSNEGASQCVEAYDSWKMFNLKRQTPGVPPKV